MEHESEPLKANKPKKKTLKEKYQYLRQNFTIEPVLACYVVPVVLSRLATQNLNLDKACRLNLKYGDAVCDALIARKGDMYRKEEAAVQELVAGMEAWKNIIHTALPSFLILFIGAWSDRTRKRKICILLPIVGDLLSCVSDIFSTYFFYELPLELCMFLEAFFPAITGGWITMFMGAFCYISDVSSEESRTFRVGVANLCLTAGGPIGTALSGILLEKIGYYGVFSISSVLCLFSIIYGMYYIKDPDLPRPQKVDEDKGFLKTFFNPKHVKDTLTIAFKKGPNRRRTKSILVLASIAFIYGPSYGEMTVRYLFSRYRFNWDALKYSFYQTFYTVLHGIGALVSVSIFSRKFGWGDSVLGLISSVSKIAGGLATGMAQNSFQMYLAVVIETFNATSFTALRSISSKLVTSDELGKLSRALNLMVFYFEDFLGKMTSLFNLTEVVTSMIFGPMYSWIYMMTLKYDAGFVYYLSTCLTFAPILIFGWFFKQDGKSRNNRKSKDDKNCKDNTNKNDSWKPKEKKNEDSVICKIDLADEKIIIE